MQVNKPSLLYQQAYQQALEAGNHRPDEVQRQAVILLDRIFQSLVQLTTTPPTLPGRLKSFLNYFPGNKTHVMTRHPIQGLYMWGGVGRGKTWLMDLFFHSLPGNRKLRLHFHRFMLRVHEELTQLQGHTNPLERVADNFRAQADVLCFDEFFVADITDAMILGTLLNALFNRGITLVATSNIPPEKLYYNGLQRAQFLPAIALIEQYCDVINVDAGVDYRQETLNHMALFFTPLNEQTQQKMMQIFITLAGKEGSGEVALEVNHHMLLAIDVANGVLAIDFYTLCEQPCSQLDYIALSALYHSVLLHNVRRMGAENEDTARRFLALVDEFYERRVKLVISAEVAMHDIYYGQRLTFEWLRCVSRLQEMQSAAWRRLPHRP